jgi:Cys-rich four helix bundle protein (predicted Tat secretion target)
MDRREFAMGAVLAGLALAAEAGAAEPAATPNPHQAPAAATSALDALAAAARACAAASDVCIRHCATELAAGNKSMANCNFAAHAVNAVSAATATLASLRAARTAEILPATIASAQACATACREHQQHFAMGMHLECKACADACDALVAAAKAADAVI